MDRALVDTVYHASHVFVARQVGRENFRLRAGKLTQLGGNVLEAAAVASHEDEVIPETRELSRELPA
jgi:hypothetical protein